MAPPPLHPSWQQVQTFQQLADHTAKWLSGGISGRTPWQYGTMDALYPDTKRMLEPLVKMNQSGFVTTDSQDGATGAVTQRAYVIGIMMAKHAARIFEAAASTEYIMLTGTWAQTQPLLDTSGIVVTLDGKDATTAVSDSRLVSLHDFASAGVELPQYLLKHAQPVAFVDPVWGRSRRLYDAVNGWLASHPVKFKQPQAPLPTLLEK